MPKVKFLVDRDVYAHGEIEVSYKAGEVYDLPAASADRWLRRKVAVEYVEPPKPKVTIKAKPKKKAEPEE